MCKAEGLFPRSTNTVFGYVKWQEMTEVSKVATNQSGLKSLERNPLKYRALHFFYFILHFVCDMLTYFYLCFILLIFRSSSQLFFHRFISCYVFFLLFRFIFLAFFLFLEFYKMGKKEGKFRPRTGHEGPEREYRYSSTLSLTSALDEGAWLTSRPVRFTARKETRYSLYRRLCRAQGRSGRVRKMSPPPGFDPRTVQPEASCYPGSHKMGTGSLSQG
jgi:hypothetical protein